MCIFCRYQHWRTTWRTQSTRCTRRRRLRTSFCRTLVTCSLTSTVPSTLSSTAPSDRSFVACSCRRSAGRHVSLPVAVTPWSTCRWLVLVTSAAGDWRALVGQANIGQEWPACRYRRSPTRLFRKMCIFKVLEAHRVNLWHASFSGALKGAESKSAVCPAQKCPTRPQN